VKPRSFASRIRRTACSLAVLLSLAAPAAAQTDTRSLVDQIDRLRRDVDVLQRQLARGGPAPAPGAVGGSAAGGVSTSFIEQTDSRFADLDTQLRDITGRVEELNFKVTQLTERLDKLVGDVDFRLSALERGGAPAAASAAPGPAAAAPASPPPAGRAPTPSEAQVPPGQTRMVLVPGPAGAQPTPGAALPAQTAAVTLPAGSPEAQYEFAYAQLLQAQREQGDFGRAESALKAFVAANPNHRLAGNAQYWLGETYYVRNDMTKAAQTFLEGVKKYPDGPKAADTMLKLGMALTAINQKAEACGVFGELKNRFPNLSRDTATGLAAARERAACR